MITTFRIERVSRQKTKLTDIHKFRRPADWQDTHERLEASQIRRHKQLIEFVEDLEPIPMQESWAENIIEVPKSSNND